jgi:hypothetical protein
MHADETPYHDISIRKTSILNSSCSTWNRDGMNETYIIIVKPYGRMTCSGLSWPPPSGWRVFKDGCVRDHRRFWKNYLVFWRPPLRSLLGQLGQSFPLLLIIRYNMIQINGNPYAIGPSLSRLRLIFNGGRWRREIDRTKIAASPARAVRKIVSDHLMERTTWNCPTGQEARRVINIASTIYVKLCHFERNHSQLIVRCAYRLV